LITRSSRDIGSDRRNLAPPRPHHRQPRDTDRLAQTVRYAESEGIPSLRRAA
jgi:hypothetical protein